MNVAARSEYGLRALMHLTGSREGELVPAREIATSAGVPVKYLEQILKVLREAGLVEGHVGVSGGYRLTRDARLITAGEAVRLLDGRLGLGTPAASPLRDDALGELWQEVDDAVAAVLDRVSIADLASRLRQSRRAAAAVG